MYKLSCVTPPKPTVACNREVPNRTYDISGYPICQGRNGPESSDHAASSHRYDHLRNAIYPVCLFPSDLIITGNEHQEVDVLDNMAPAVHPDSCPVFCSFCRYSPASIPSRDQLIQVVPYSMSERLIECICVEQPVTTFKTTNITSLSGGLIAAS